MHGQKTDLAVALADPGRFPVKTIAETLGVARSNLIERQQRVRPARGSQTRPGDNELAAEIRRLVDARPTYGYRRIAELLKRERRSAGQDAVNAKRVYRLMKKHGLLLARHTGHRPARRHEGQVAPCTRTFAGAPTGWSSPVGMVRSFGWHLRSTAMIAK